MENRTVDDQGRRLLREDEIFLPDTSDEEDSYEYRMRSVNSQSPPISNLNSSGYPTPNRTLADIDEQDSNSVTSHPHQNIDIFINLDTDKLDEESLPQDNSHTYTFPQDSNFKKIDTTSTMELKQKLTIKTKLLSQISASKWWNSH